MVHSILFTLALVNPVLVLASPTQDSLSINTHKKFYDVQAHRGGRGNTVESTLPSFAWGLVDGATTLELDNGITLDGEVIVWHDEEITAAKCRDTGPVTPNDPNFPYVGKFIANLTLAQIKTLDCGSIRQEKYPQQLLYPGARIPTLKEVFDFVSCVDPSHSILWNIESKIDAPFPNRTASVQDFVRKQHAVFLASPYYQSITYQSFDWRTLIAMKELDPKIITSALIDEDTAFLLDNSTTPWLAGLRLDDFPGPSLGEQMAQAARAINADILSPTATVVIPSPEDPTRSVKFTTQSLISEAHRLGMQVKPWTVNRLDIADELLQWGADGIITDYPNVVRRWAKQQGLSVAPKYPKQRVFLCLEKHMQTQGFEDTRCIFGDMTHDDREIQLPYEDLRTWDDVQRHPVPMLAALRVSNLPKLVVIPVIAFLPAISMVEATAHASPRHPEKNEWMLLRGSHTANRSMCALMSHSREMFQVIVAGGGIAGAALALFLSHLDTRITILEGRPCRPNTTEGGIIMLAPNGMNALQGLGLAQTLLQRESGIQAPYFTISDGAGDLIGRIPQGSVERHGFASTATLRWDIHEVLLNEVERRSLDMRWSSRVESVQELEDGVLVGWSEAGERKEKKVDLLVGADGIWSTVRPRYCFARLVAPSPRYSGLVGIGTILDIDTVSGLSSFLTLERPVVMVHSRLGFVGMMLFDKTGKKVAWWTTHEAPEKSREEWKVPREQLFRELSERYSSDAYPVPQLIAAAEASAEQPFVWPVYEVEKLGKWHGKRTVLIGDAAHAMPPHSGQGASQALEDAAYLAYLLRLYLDKDKNVSQTSTELQSVLATFQKERQPRVDGIVDEANKRGDMKRETSRFGMFIRKWVMKMVFFFMTQKWMDTWFAYKVPGIDEWAVLRSAARST
ncbi:hypothetical protein ID866_817 [Astraeus odoratus]|nr:hypothetical protein ID866_817 [Astraeus odoratus]